VRGDDPEYEYLRVPVMMIDSRTMKEREVHSYQPTKQIADDYVNYLDGDERISYFDRITKKFIDGNKV
jgi:hypothetical protein